MRIANHDGRAVLVLADDKGVDVARASHGEFGSSIADLYSRWEELRAWVDSLGAPDDLTPDVVIDPELLGAPSPRPAQAIAIGLNYEEHAHETGYQVPTRLPPVFAKFTSSITGPRGVVDLPPGGHTDWEVEVVAVIGRTAHRITADRAWDHVAGLTVGQDLSERVSQMAGPAPQFGLAKSFPGFSPMGPWLVTPDELTDPDDLALGCAIDGEPVQDGRTSKLIFSIPRSIAALSQVLTLLPGDVVFTGTPDGVGLGRSPQRFLRPGETLRTWVEGIGEMVHTFR
jgi:2-keto-4-pentenoate hydratase/2-oxohepta-3-ene-1,7-dioic acid hydratase in catechol pathway